MDQTPNIFKAEVRIIIAADFADKIKPSSILLKLIKAHVSALKILSMLNNHQNNQLDQCHL